MKKSLLFSAVLAGLMLGSCSSSDDLAGGNTPANQDGNGYVAFNIHLPSQSGSSSRAANDEFKDGMKSEYDVKDATLLIFEGSSESAAEFKGAYKLNTAPWTAPVPDGNITTTSATIVKQINTPTSASDCYALVVLNNNGVFSVDESNKTITLAGETTTFSGTYKNFAESLSDKNLTQTGFYMANAPLADAPGGSTPITGVNVKTLVSLDGKIMATESAAKGAPADIYVERGVAKVTMQSSTTATVVQGSKPKGSTAEVAFSMTDWCLDNTNKSTYLVRSTEDFDKWANLFSNSTSVSAEKYRFVGSKPVATGLYRTYFAKDANYTKAENDAALAANELLTKTSPDFVSKFGDENPQYCFENTFNVESQLDHFTTRVLIKAKLNSGNTFYVINGDQNTIYPLSEVEKEIKKYYLIENEAWIKDHVHTVPATGKSEIDGDDLEVTISDNAGTVTITGIAFKSTVTVDPAFVASVPTNYTEVMDRIGTIDEYKDGESYYFVRIKHFGDDLTPWKNNEIPLPSTSSVYPTGAAQDGNYLGRYGVLRNNWYDIAVDGVKGLGSSTVPKVTPTTDDEMKSYIAVKINVLSWAKRTQSATLGE